MSNDLQTIEIETAKVRLEREKLLLQKDIGSAKPKSNKLQKYLVGTSLLLASVVGFGIYTVEKNNKCDSWQHSRWFDLLTDELKKDPAKYQQYMDTVGRIPFSQAPETWAGARGVFPYMVEKTAESGLVKLSVVDAIANQVRLESVANLGCR